MFAWSIVVAMLAQSTYQPATSNVDVASSPNPSAFQGVASFSAMVSGNAPTGSVTFMVGSSALCAPVPVASDGSASCTQSFAELGSYTITAVYSGDANNASATSAPLTQLVGRAPGYILLSTRCGNQTAIAGRPYTFYAMALGWGSATFSTSSGQVLCENVETGEYGASCVTSTLRVGGTGASETVDVFATYTGDLDYLPSISAPLSVTVIAASESVFRDGFAGQSAVCPADR